MKIAKLFILPAIWLFLGLVSLEMSIYGLMYIHFDEWKHGAFWQGNLIAWTVFSAIEVALFIGVIVVGIQES